MTVNNEKVFCSNGSGQLADDQPSVVFVHGAGMDHSVWVMPARYFARHKYNVVSVDLPGHGKSAGEPCPTIDAMADFVAAVLTELEIDEAAIVGHSMGSLVTLNFAARHSGLTRSLALLGTSTPMPVTKQLLAAAKDNSHDAIDMANTWSHSRYAQIGGNENPGMWMTGGGQRLLERAGKDVFFTDLNACNEFTNGEQLAAEIACETLVMIGTEDLMTAPISAEKVASIIPNSRILWLDKCGHAMPSERPNMVLDGLITIV